LPTVSDAGPLIHLAQIRKLSVLKDIFGEVVIVPKVKHEVVDEGIRVGHEDAIAVRGAMEEGWIEILKPTREITKKAKELARDENISTSDAETLILARQEQASAFLTDERPLSNLAKMYGLRVWNTWTILLKALADRLIDQTDIQQAIDELGRKRHKLKNEDAEEILKIARSIAMHNHSE